MSMRKPGMLQLRKEVLSEGGLDKEKALEVYRGVADGPLQTAAYGLLDLGQLVGNPRRYADLIDGAELTPARMRQILIMLCELIELKEMPYADYLKTAHWQWVASEAKESTGGRCGLDTRHIAVDAHHRTYDRRGREYVEDVIPLCRECHSRFHGR